MNKKILIIFALFTLGQNSQAQRIRITGEAARSLFICDTEAEHDCWYALGTSFCDLETEKPVGIIESSMLAIHGFTAARISEITRHCSDGDRLTPYYYSQGIDCYPDQKLEYHCMLNIDRSWIKEEIPGARQRLPLIEVRRGKKYKIQAPVSRKEKKRFTSMAEASNTKNPGAKKF